MHLIGYIGGKGMSFQSYDPGDFFDELFVSQGQARPVAQSLVDTINTLSSAELLRRRDAAQQVMLRQGATFTVYGDGEGTERILPFDVIPRVVSHGEWLVLEEGLKQRIHALNLFLADIYGEQKIIADGIIPRELIESATGFLKPCLGLKPNKDIWCHITGTDLVRDRQGTWYVLEDNLRCPSGVSYVLENRRVMKSTFPRLFHQMAVQPVDNYPSRLLETLLNIVPESVDCPTVAVLTPGAFNSAYFEHSYLAQQMGIMLVEGRDLVVSDGELKMRTTKGLKRLDVLYRRIDDLFMDPTVFRADSMLGVPGMMDVYRQGNLGLANAPGTGVADDKVIYAYVPEIIRYYLGEDAKLQNVPTYLCWEPKQQEYVLNNLDKLVVKAADESGGYGMLVGPHATETERAEFGDRIKAHPRKYIAQPTLCLSRVPTMLEDEAGCQLEGCHVDLRPYVLYGEDIYVNPGGLTRVAMRRGSLVVNSSQGGGSKDTWVVSAQQ